MITLASLRSGVPERSMRRRPIQRGFGSDACGSPVASTRRRSSLSWRVRMITVRRAQLTDKEIRLPVPGKVSDDHRVRVNQMVVQQFALPQIFHVRARPQVDQSPIVLLPHKAGIPFSQHDFDTPIPIKIRCSQPGGDISLRKDVSLPFTVGQQTIPGLPGD